MKKPDQLDPMNPSTALDPDSVFADLDPIRHEAYAWIARFMSGDMTSDDVTNMKAWYARSAAHRVAYAEARQIWRSLGPVAGGSRRQIENPMPRHPVAADAARLTRRRLFLGGALAASAAWLALNPPLELWPSYAELSADFRTGAGERRQIAFADAVSLDLNTRTSIAVRSHSAAAAQIELLSGETAISTDSAAALTVIAATGRIIATQADFNLRCDGSQVTVSCLKGHVAVERGGVTTMLSADQQIGYAGHQMGQVAAINPEVVTAWQHGLLIFEFTPVERVIAEINRYRTARIVLLNDEIGRRLLNARLRTDETDKIIVQIVHIFGAKARTIPGGIVLLT
jgi:transmembrane sensor